MTNRDELIKYIKNGFYKILINQNKLNIMYQYAEQKYNFNMREFADYVSERGKDISEVSNSYLFAMIDSYEYATGIKKENSIINQHFTEREIKEFSKQIIKEKKLDWPICFDMIQISDDQWIGFVDAKYIVLLFNNNLVNYNPNTQRPMREYIKNDNVYYTISINKKAVNDITRELSNETYISDDITFNIPEGEEDFEYNPDNKQLKIKSIKAFDILDGYHRCVSITKAKILNENFNYPMELRITHFSEEKAQKFIYQKDQKTKMSKANSDSYDVYAPQNIITKKINESSTCNIQGYIGRVQNKINISKFSELVKILFIEKVDKKPDERRMIIEISKEIIDDFNILTEEDMGFLDISYNTRTLICVMCVFKYISGRSNKNGISKLIKDTIQESKNLNRVIFNTSHKLTKQNISRIMEIIESVDDHV